MGELLRDAEKAIGQQLSFNKPPAMKQSSCSSCAEPFGGPSLSLARRSPDDRRLANATWRLGNMQAKGLPASAKTLTNVWKRTKAAAAVLGLQAEVSFANTLHAKKSQHKAVGSASV